MFDATLCDDLDLPKQLQQQENINLVLLGLWRDRTWSRSLPEAGKQRMRDVIKKGFTDANLVRGVRLGYEEGYRLIKFYFMIKLPSETAVDCEVSSTSWSSSAVSVPESCAIQPYRVEVHAENLHSIPMEFVA